MDTNDQTTSVESEQVQVQAPVTPPELRALDSAVSKLESVLRKLADDDTADIVSQYDSKIAVLSAIDDDDITGPMIAALTVKRDALVRDSRQSALARILASDVGQRLVSLVPAREVVREVVREVPTGSKRAGTSSATGDDRIATSADGRQYVRTVLSRQRADDEIALEEACGKIGCRFSEILADAPTAKLSGYRMNMTKAVTAMTSDQIEEHRQCMHAAAYATFRVSDAAVSCLLYAPSER